LTLEELSGGAMMLAMPMVVIVSLLFEVMRAKKVGTINRKERRSLHVKMFLIHAE